jgi:hypothetical protein
MRGAAARAVVADSDLPALFRELADELPQRPGQFPETDPVRGPVVHLKVDVRRVAAAPGRPYIHVPDALQVRRLRAAPR